ncbi:hypothetical protein [Streptomyces sp. NPDC020681]|uniref:hypothetical protein n=1 Tax=Streptomyces sp. NPDC020681 TaxID=3365083 RepID=UPI0037959EFC
MTGFTGRWALRGAVSHDPGVKYVFTGDDRTGVEAVVGDVQMTLDLLIERWLAGEALVPEPAVEPASGLVLDIGPDLTFTERGAAEVEWFCEEGVLEPRAKPFDGRIVTKPTGSHLLLSEPVTWAQPYREDVDVPLRMDDGDTKIADTIELVGARLRRRVSVVTDEMYVTRVLYEYGPDHPHR